MIVPDFWASRMRAMSKGTGSPRSVAEITGIFPIDIDSNI
jgi:hypothetical protein